MAFSRVFSALCLWMDSISTLVLVRVTLDLEVQLVVHVLVDLLLVPVLLQEAAEHPEAAHPQQRRGGRASRVPRRLPYPVCRPLLFATADRRARAREWIASGFLITNPSFTSLRMFWRELAMEISLDSLGSSQTFLWPHFSTAAARRFCSFRLGMAAPARPP